MKVAAIYHSRDLDGWMSGAIIKKWFEETYPHDRMVRNFTKGEFEKENTLDLLPWDYGDGIPDFERYDKVILADVSFPADKMLELHQDFYIRDLESGFVWLDHHISAIDAVIEKFKETGAHNEIGYPEGIRNTKFAACELTWKYFFEHKEVPELVRRLGAWDCFRHKGNSEELTINCTQYGARQMISNVYEAFTWLNASNAVEKAMEAGHYVYNHLLREAKSIYKNAFPARIDLNGRVLYFACVNSVRLNPASFNIDYHADSAYDEEFGTSYYDGFISYHFNGKKWSFSFYNENGNVDCSQVAKMFGGGGHPGASGCVVDNVSDVIPDTPQE